MSSQQAPTTDRVRAAWDTIAPRFDDLITTENIALGEDVLRRVGLRPGMRLLDVASGSGALSIPAARIGADVLAIDLAPAMLARLDARARREGLVVECRAMDGHALELDDDTFDLVVSLNGVSVLQDMARGLAEMVRVTRPGGRVAVAAFGPLPRAELISFFAAAMAAAVEGVAPVPADPPPLPFQVADPAVLRRHLADAGSHDVHVEQLTWDMHVRSAEHFWDAFTSSNPIGAELVAGLSAEQRADVLQVLDGMLRERSGGGPAATLHAAINLGVGTA